MGWEKRETRSSLNRLFKRDSRQHSFVVFGNDIVFTLGYLIVIAQERGTSELGISRNALSKKTPTKWWALIKY